MTNQDDGLRGNSGVVASLIERPDGKVRLVLDDVTLAASTGSTHWRNEKLYTFVEWPRELVEKMALSPQDYQTLGENLLTRLLAQGSAVGGYSTRAE
jgi:hypothetical protein